MGPTSLPSPTAQAHFRTWCLHLGEHPRILLPPPPHTHTPEWAIKWRIGSQVIRPLQVLPLSCALRPRCSLRSRGSKQPPLLFPAFAPRQPTSAPLACASPSQSCQLTHAFTFLTMPGFLSHNSLPAHPQVTAGNSSPSPQKSLVPSCCPRTSLPRPPASGASGVRATCFSRSGHRRAPIHSHNRSPPPSLGNAFR